MNTNLALALTLVLILAFVLTRHCLGGGASATGKSSASSGMALPKRTGSGGGSAAEDNTTAEFNVFKQKRFKIDTVRFSNTPRVRGAGGGCSLGEVDRRGEFCKFQTLFGFKRSEGAEGGWWTWWGFVDLLPSSHCHFQHRFGNSSSNRRSCR